MLKYLKTLIAKTRKQSKNNTQNSVEEERDKSTSGDSYEVIDDTPFALVQKDGKWFIALGEYKITDDYENEEDALKAPNDKMWLTIMHMITSTIHKLKNEQNA